jgi:flagellar protein FliO/FliZ
MVLSLVFVLSLVPVSMWFLKRTGYNRSGKGGSLRIVSSLALGQKERLIVVDDGHEHILLGVTAHTINRLGTVPPPPASAAAAMPASNAFVQLLQRARSGPLPPSTHAPQ